MTKNNYKLRPDSVGFWWCNDNGRVSIGRAKYIDKICYDGDFDDGSKELAWSSGGCFTACRTINSGNLNGSQWVKQEPPKIFNENACDNSNPDDLCQYCNCWKYTRANCS